jgi:hypothetical protein
MKQGFRGLTQRETTGINDDTEDQQQREKENNDVKVCELLIECLVECRGIMSNVDKIYMLADGSKPNMCDFIPVCEI